jgi:hypothetical protein
LTGFEFFTILTDVVRAGIEDIDIHPELAPLISNYILSFLN